MSDFYLQLWILPYQIYFKCWYMKIRGGSRIPRGRGHQPPRQRQHTILPDFSKMKQTILVHKERGLAPCRVHPLDRPLKMNSKMI